MLPQKQVSIDIFLNTNVKMMISNNYHMSCVKSEFTVFSSYYHWYMCIGILPKTWMQILYCFISICIMMFNAVDLLHQIQNFYF